MDIEFSVSGLLTLLKAERKSGEVIPLKQDFYTKLNEKIKTFSTESDEYKNMEKMTNSIKERRTQKIIVYIAYNKELPRPMPSEEEKCWQRQH